jgi:hypothetical protein
VWYLSEAESIATMKSLSQKSQVDGWDYFETYRFGKTANITVGP